MRRSMAIPLDDANVARMLWNAPAAGFDRPAIVARDAMTTYGALLDRTHAFAESLVARGVTAGDRVAIFLDRGADAAAAFFGATATGAIAVFVNETLRPRQAEHILSHSGATLLITGADLLARQPRAIETSARTLLVSEVAATGAFEPVPRVAGDVAQIIYTSGSTGLPKGVAITHGNLWAGMRAVSTYLAIGSDDRIASLLPFSFDYGFNQLLCAVGNGAALVVERSPAPQEIATAIASLGVTVLPCVPPLWLQLLGAPAFRDAPIPTLRAMTNTGGRIPIPAVRAIRAAQPHAALFLMYGLTEAFRATYLSPELVDAHPDSIGRAIPGCEVMVLRDDLTPCDVGEVGELVQRGLTVTAGYWSDPAATARVFRSNPLRPPGTPDHERVVFSGDLVRRDSDGLLFFVGRRDRLIKSLGFRVSPDEVAEVIHASGEVDEAIVGTEPDEARGALIVAFVVLRAGGSLQRLQRHCRTELPRHMQPARIEVRGELPRTSSGKFDLLAAQATPRG